MEDQTSTITKARASGESKIFGVSLRGIIALIVICTVCVMSFAAVEVKEPLYTLAGLIVGFYFGQNQATKPQG